jgi:hypothetical protein
MLVDEEVRRRVAEGVRRYCELEGIFRLGRPNGELLAKRDEIRRLVDEHREDLEADPVLRGIFMVFDAPRRPV